jgi:tetratricopeptide (TPR) repeat protein
MIAQFLMAAASVASAAPPPVTIPPEALLRGASQAIAAGRLDQARLMTSRAVAEGLHGEAVERVLADLAFADGKYDEALARYESLLADDKDNAGLLERAGIAAVKLGDNARAARLLRRATARTAATWRAWDALGVVSDLDRDWTQADDAYANALKLAPGEAEVINNRGWSHLLRGDWSEASVDFARAAAISSNSTRIANNLELAREALSADLPRRRAGESDEDWAQRLNDAGVAAQLLGDKARAIAAFTQALEASGRWYARAANNLEAVRGQ